MSSSIGVTNLAKNINAGKITINKVTFNGKFSPTAESTDNTWSTHIGGIAGYTTGTISKSENSGAITVGSGATFSSETSIGGAVGYTAGALTSVNNTANVTVAGKMSALGYVAGGVGLVSADLNTCTNSGAVSVSTTNSATTYVGGYAGYIIGGEEYKSVSNTGDVTFSGNSGNYTLAMGGMAGATVHEQLIHLAVPTHKGSHHGVNAVFQIGADGFAYRFLGIIPGTDHIIR